MWNIFPEQVLQDDDGDHSRAHRPVPPETGGLSLGAALAVLTYLLTPILLSLFLYYILRPLVRF